MELLALFDVKDNSEKETGQAQQWLSKYLILKRLKSKNGH